MSAMSRMPPRFPTRNLPIGGGIGAFSRGGSCLPVAVLARATNFAAAANFLLPFGGSTALSAYVAFASAPGELAIGAGSPSAGGPTTSDSGFSNFSADSWSSESDSEILSTTPVSRQAVQKHMIVGLVGTATVRCASDPCRRDALPGDVALTWHPLAVLLRNPLLIGVDNSCATPLPRSKFPFRASADQRSDTRKGSK